MGVDGRVEVTLAADVQARILIYIDKLGAEDALAVVVIECLPGHEQLQELVAAGAERAHLRDVIGIMEQRAQAGDTALYLALNQDVCRADAPLRAGILPLRVGDVVDHHAHDAAIGAVGLSGQHISVIDRQRGGCLGRRGPGHGRCSRFTGSRRRASLTGGRCVAVHQLFDPPGHAAAQRGAARPGAARQGQQRCRHPRKPKYRPTRNFHCGRPPVKALGRPAQRGWV